MILMGTVTEVTYDDPDDAGIIRTVELGVRKPGRSGSKPTFFRVAFTHGKAQTPTEEVNTFEPGDQVTIDGVDATVRLVWELDELGRTSPVIRMAGNAVVAGTTRRTTNHF